MLKQKLINIINEFNAEWQSLINEDIVTHDEFVLTRDALLAAINSIDEANIEDMDACRQAVFPVFKIRSARILGSHLDYTTWPDLVTNRMCEAIAEKLQKPSDKKMTLLMPISIPADWTDAAEVEEIPTDFTEFCRLSDGTIHRYKDLMQMAFTRINLNYVIMQNIWHSADYRTVYQPLDEKDLEMLKNRSPKIKNFIEWTEELNSLCSGSLLEQINRLREGLRRGDAHNEGLELYAASPAYVVTARFYEWFSNLNERTQQAIRNVEGFAPILNTLFTLYDRKRDKEQRSDPRFCVQIIGQQIDDMLTNQAARNTITAIEIENNHDAAYGRKVLEIKNNLGICAKNIEDQLNKENAAKYRLMISRFIREGREGQLLADKKHSDYLSMTPLSRAIIWTISLTWMTAIVSYITMLACSVAIPPFIIILLVLCMVPGSIFAAPTNYIIFNEIPNRIQKRNLKKTGNITTNDLSDAIYFIQQLSEENFTTLCETIRAQYRSAGMFKNGFGLSGWWRSYRSKCLVKCLDNMQDINSIKYSMRDYLCENQNYGKHLFCVIMANIKRSISSNTHAMFDSWVEKNTEILSCLESKTQAKKQLRQPTELNFLMESKEEKSDLDEVKIEIPKIPQNRICTTAFPSPQLASTEITHDDIEMDVLSQAPRIQPG